MYEIVTYVPEPDDKEPCGTLLKKRWGHMCHFGVIIEVFYGPDGKTLFRGMYDDGMSHDYGHGVTSHAVNAARPPVHMPVVKLLLHDRDSNVGKGAIRNDKGEITIDFKVTRKSDIVDLDDPLTMPIARDCGQGIEVGMVLSRFTEPVNGQETERYRVIFSDGEGYLTDREGVTLMNNLYKLEGNLDPIVVSVTAVNPTNTNPT